MANENNPQFQINQLLQNRVEALEQSNRRSQVIFSKLLAEAMDLQVRNTVAIETMARSLAAISQVFQKSYDMRDSSIRMKDVERAQVYSQRLGGKLRSKKG